MKKIELVYREILDQKKKLTQLELAKKLQISLSTVNFAIKPLRDMGAIEVKLKNFSIVDYKKILYYCASIRNPHKDIIYQTRAEKPVAKIESEMPSEVIFGAYSAYKFTFKDVPADYSEVYVYCEGIDEVQKRFPKNNKIPNLFALKKDMFMRGKTTSLAHTFVDLWNLKEWYAKEFSDNLLIRLE